MIPLDEVIHFDAITSNPTTGAVADADSTPTFEVFEEATDTDIGVGGNLTKRTSKTGNYRGSFTASAANGFELGKWYNVIGSATVGGIAGKAVLKSFRILAAEHTAGYIVSTIKDGTGTGELDTNLGVVLAKDHTGANLATASALDAVDNFVDTEVAAIITTLGTPSNLGSGATVAANLVDIEGQTDDIGTAGAGLTAVPWNAAWDAEVQSEVDDALVVHRLDELLNADSDIDGLAPPTVGSVFHELMSKTAGSFTFDQTSDSLEALADTQGTPQTGDSFAIVNSGTHGNAALKTLIDAVDNFVDTEIAAIISTLGTPSNLGGGATLAFNLSDIEAQTDDIGAAGAGLTAVVWNAAWDAEVQSEVDDALKAALTEDYRATGATGSVRDLLYEILQNLTEFAIVTTTKTAKKLDGTTAKTYTLDSATTPTSITETT